MADAPPPDREIVAVRHGDVGGHVSAVKMRDGSVREAADLIDRIQHGDHEHFFMKPPEGAPAYRAHQGTGLPLLVQVRRCPDCGAEVLFA